MNLNEVIRKASALMVGASFVLLVQLSNFTIDDSERFFYGGVIACLTSASLSWVLAALGKGAEEGTANAKRLEKFAWWPFGIAVVTFWGSLTWFTSRTNRWGDDLFFVLPFLAVAYLWWAIGGITPKR